MSVHPSPHKPDYTLYAQAALGLALSFGVTLTLFTLMYLRDLRDLPQLPGMVWDFLCGIPNPDGAALPVLVLTALASFIAAAAIAIGWQIARQRG